SGANWEGLGSTGRDWEHWEGLGRGTGRDWDGLGWKIPGLNWSTLVHTGPYWSILVQTGPYWSVLVPQEFPGAGVPQFDLLLLGLGPDGHTCSLFPGHALLQEQQALVGFLEDSPKPPARRVTMTLPLLNAARSVLLVAAGAAKAPAVKRILEGREEFPLPAARVRPRSGRLRWLLDREAAEELRNPPGKNPGNPGIPGGKKPGAEDPHGE
ncbi:6-phosphogluconolactonase, partial [Cyanistes caeruleus]|uniref:6-phosphogluconolactonase n=1 Tax=Cyanistes caeruleus TaxID=156563 RepID=UPI000CDB0688